MNKPTEEISDLAKAQLSFLEKEVGLVYGAIRDNIKSLVNSLTIGISFSGASLFIPILKASNSSSSLASSSANISEILFNIIRLFPLFGYANLFYALFLINEIAYQSGYRRYLEEKIKLIIYPPSISLWESSVFKIKNKDITNFLLFGVYWIFIVFLSAVVWEKTKFPFMGRLINLWWTVFSLSTILGGISVCFTLTASERTYKKLKNDESIFYKKLDLFSDYNK